ncbi:MAG: nucleotide exchange factor GrpE [Patescibacteria group bacterium]|nr:nucleotide exchange factor GrpE [Patescibacteria group bacterium]
MKTKKIEKKKKDQNQQIGIEELERELNDYKNKYLRALADYQNLEKRIEEERKEITNKAKSELLLKLLPFLDNLDRAEVFFKDEGLRLVKESFLKILKELGLEEIDVLGKEFDPHFSEAVEVVNGEKDNVIVEVTRKGYKLGDKILRVAQVKVSKKVIS